MRFDTVLDKLQLMHDTLTRWGMQQPRIALAALNPHGGEGGLLGQEEVAELAPAVYRHKLWVLMSPVRYRQIRYLIERLMANLCGFGLS